MSDKSKKVKSQSKLQETDVENEINFEENEEIPTINVEDMNDSDNEDEDNENEDNENEDNENEDNDDDDDDDDDNSENSDNSDNSESMSAIENKVAIDLSDNDYYKGLCTLLEDEHGNNILVYISLLHTELIGVNKNLRNMRKEMSRMANCAEIMVKKSS